MAIIKDFVITKLVATQINGQNDFEIWYRPTRFDDAAPEEGTFYGEEQIATPERYAELSAGLKTTVRTKLSAIITAINNAFPAP